MRRKIICVILSIFCAFGSALILTGCGQPQVEIKFDTDAYQDFECAAKHFFKVVISFSGDEKAREKYSVEVKFEFENADVVITEGNHDAALKPDSSVEGLIIFSGIIAMYEDKAIEFRITPHKIGDAKISMNATAIGNKFSIRNGQRSAPVTFTRGKLVAPILIGDLNSLIWTRSEYAGGYRIFRVDENGENPTFQKDFDNKTHRWDLEDTEVQMLKNSYFVVQATSGDIDSFDNSDNSNVNRIVVVD